MTIVHIIFIFIICWFINNHVEYWAEKGQTISVCVPCIPRDEGKLPTLLRSIKNQTLKPDEVIIAISETTPERGKYLERELSKIFPVRVVATLRKQRAGPNRNRATAASSGNIISFFDADDVMHPQRLELIRKAFMEYDPYCVVHGYDEKDFSHQRWEDLDVMKCDEIVKHKLTTKEAQRFLQEARAPIDGSIQFYSIEEKGYKLCHGHPSFKREVFNHLQYGNEKRGEDAQFLFKLVDYYGVNDKTMLLILYPLTLYIK